VEIHSSIYKVSQEDGLHRYIRAPLLVTNTLRPYIQYTGRWESTAKIYAEITLSIKVCFQPKLRCGHKKSLFKNLYGCG